MDTAQLSLCFPDAKYLERRRRRRSIDKKRAKKQTCWKNYIIMYKVACNRNCYNIAFDSRLYLTLAHCKGQCQSHAHVDCKYLVTVTYINNVINVEVLHWLTMAIFTFDHSKDRHQSHSYID